jgi:hypothetical protein
MRRWIRFILLSGYMLGPWVAGCAQPARFYVSQPAHTLQSEKTAAVAVWIEDRTLIWMNGVTLRARLIDLEQVGCGHIAKNIGDGFWVDSIMPPRGNVILTPRTASWTCHNDEVPIHWHPTVKTICASSARPTWALRT